jgi:hypothetical protein
MLARARLFPALYGRQLLATLFLLLLLEPLHLLVELVASHREALCLVAIRNVEHFVLERGALAIDRNKLVELLALQQREGMTAGERKGEYEIEPTGMTGDTTYPPHM